ncbi:MAG: hypothetical protein B6D37_06070 [Sphingobacteriales bacterium UTBCD1]|nr:MAG: hypothetical protein B6D37_06070 [Sphingobacteriales bacterium UTBCD1]
MTGIDSRSFFVGTTGPALHLLQVTGWPVKDISNIFHLPFVIIPGIFSLFPLSLQSLFKNR